MYCINYSFYKRLAAVALWCGGLLTSCQNAPSMSMMANTTTQLSCSSQSDRPVPSHVNRTTTFLEVMPGCMMPHPKYADAKLTSLPADAQAMEHAQSKASLCDTTGLVASFVASVEPETPPTALKTPQALLSFTAASGEQVGFYKVKDQWQAEVRFQTLPVISKTPIDAMLTALRTMTPLAARSRIHIVRSSQKPYSSMIYIGWLGLQGGAPQPQTAPEKATKVEVRATLSPNRACVFHRIPVGSYYQDMSPMPVTNDVPVAHYYVESNDQDAISELENDTYRDAMALEEVLQSARFARTLRLDALANATLDIGPHNQLGSYAAIVLLGSSSTGMLSEPSAVGIDIRAYITYAVHSPAQTTSRKGEVSPQQVAAAMPPFSSGSSQRTILPASVAVSAGSTSSTSSADPFHKPTVSAMPENPEIVPTKFKTLQRIQFPFLRFGENDWTRYFGDIGVQQPPLPPNLDAILQGACPFWRGKKIIDTHLLLLMPSQVSGRPFTLDVFANLAEHVKSDQHTVRYQPEAYRAIQDQFGNKPLVSEDGYWMLMTKEVLPGSRNQIYSTQQTMVAEQGYRVPLLLEAVTAIALNYVHIGERLYADDYMEGGMYTRCQEYVDDRQTAVGNFGRQGIIYVGLNSPKDPRYGIAACRNL